jgi:DNA-binding NarL/FixJ family response regulator
VKPVKLYIVDEHESVRSALADRLGRADDVIVLGHSSEIEQVFTDIQVGKPDIVLVEVKRTDGLGLEIVRQLASLPNPPQLAVLTSYPTDWEEKAAVRAGADAYLLKDIDSEELIRHISNATKG